MSSSTGVRRTWPEGGISSGAPHPHPPHSLTCRISTSLPAPEDFEIPMFHLIHKKLNNYCTAELFVTLVLYSRCLHIMPTS